MLSLRRSNFAAGAVVFGLVSAVTGVVFWTRLVEVLEPPLMLRASTWVSGVSAGLLTIGAFISKLHAAIRAHRIQSKVCPACGYDLRGLASPAVCPECGPESTPAGSTLRSIKTVLLVTCCWSQATLLAAIVPWLWGPILERDQGVLLSSMIVGFQGADGRIMPTLLNARRAHVDRGYFAWPWRDSIIGGDRRLCEIGLYPDAGYELISGGGVKPAVTVRSIRPFGGSGVVNPGSTLITDEAGLANALRARLPGWDSSFAANVVYGWLSADLGPVWQSDRWKLTEEEERFQLWLWVGCGLVGAGAGVWLARSRTESGS